MSCSKNFIFPVLIKLENLILLSEIIALELSIAITCPFLLPIPSKRLKEEAPKEEAPKAEAPKEEAPKADAAPAAEAPKQEQKLESSTEKK